MNEKGQLSDAAEFGVELAETVFDKLDEDPDQAWDRTKAFLTSLFIDLADAFDDPHELCPLVAWIADEVADRVAAVREAKDATKN